MKKSVLFAAVFAPVLGLSFLLSSIASASTVPMVPGQYVDVGGNRYTCDNGVQTSAAAKLYRCHAGFFTQHYSDWSYDQADARSQAQRKCLSRTHKDSSAGCYVATCETN